MMFPLDIGRTWYDEYWYGPEPVRPSAMRRLGLYVVKTLDQAVARSTDRRSAATAADGVSALDAAAATANLERWTCCPI